MDDNGDGFKDMPTGYHLNFLNRWNFKKGIWNSKLLVRGLYDQRIGGQTKEAQAESESPYIIDLRTRRVDGFWKNGLVWNQELGTSLGLIAAASYHDQTNLYGENEWRASQTNAYFNAIFNAGGIPVFLPYTEGTEGGRKYGTADFFDGILCSGGVDPDPVLYGETVTGNNVSICQHRDEMEMEFLKHIVNETKLPILGICRGLQALNVFFGGTLYDFVPDHQLPQGDIIHPTRAAGSMASLLGSYPTVNSNHHQAVNRLGCGLIPCQWAGDGIIEALWHKTLPILGVQWHPERWGSGDRIFRWFADEIAK